VDPLSISVSQWITQMSETRWEPIDDGAGLAVKGQVALIGPEPAM